MKRKIYKLLLSAKQGLFALVLTVFSGTAFAQTTYTFNYTGSAQNINLPAGTYTIETWGADGGDNLGNGSTTFLQNGGKGGYSKGTYTLASAATIYVNVGGKGANSTSVLSTTVSGGYNGGGYGSSNTTSGKSSGGGGGGATHVATATGALSAFASNQPAVLIVAGGGGGSGESNYASNNTQYNSNGGNGGGSSGLQNVTTGYLGRHGQGGTQTAGGGGGDNGAAVAGVPLQGVFGAGGYNTTPGSNTSAGGSGAGGGGGGWYGGGSGWVSTGSAYQAGSGGGGSGYIGGVTSATTIAFGQSGFVTKPILAGDGLVIIKELCSITLTASGINANGAICTGNSVTLTTNAISNYSWSTGAITSNSIVIAPTTTTTYTLGATSPSNCTAYAAITITVDAGTPTLTINNTANSGGICPTKSVALTASGATTYTWTGGSPTVTNGVVFNPITTSGYTVTGANACGSNSAATSVSIHPPPTVNLATTASSVCSGSSVSLTATGNATAYTFPSGISNGVGFVPSITTTYVIVGTSALSCTLGASIPVTVVTTPVNAPIASPPLICIGNSSTLTASGATSYTWATATQTVFTTSFTATPAAPGITTYTVTKSNANCFNTQVVSVTTNSLPTIFAIVTPTIVCALKPATLAIGGAQTYTWTSPGPPTFSFTGASPVVYPPVSSVYSVAASDGTCISTTTVYLATNPNPTITVGATSSVVCSGDATTLTAQGGINYTWTAGTTTLNTQAVTINPTTAIAYTAEGDNGFGCTSSALQVILVNPNPTLTVNATKTLVCSGGPSTLIASGANTYSWDANANNALTSSTIVNPTSPTSGSMVYSVEGKYTATGCKSTNTVLVAIFVPTLTVTGNTNTCIGGIVNLSPSGGNSGSYVWFTSIGGNPYNFATLTTTVAAAAIFTVNAITSSVSVNCPATQTVAVDVFFNPTITAVPQRTTICTKEAVDLYASGGATYVWNNAMNTATINVNPTINTTYTVTGTDANGCVSTGTVQVKVSGCAGIGEVNGQGTALLVYPNPSNGEFTIEGGSDLKLSLVNELGQLVRVIELSAANNYKISVNDLSQGIYFISGQKDNIHVYEKIVVTK